MYWESNIVHVTLKRLLHADAFLIVSRHLKKAQKWFLDRLKGKLPV